MATYSYKALDGVGKFVAGQVQAPSLEAATKQLLELGYTPLATDVQSGAAKSGLAFAWPERTVGQREVTALLQDLALVLRSGLPLDEGLQLLCEDAGTASTRLISQLRASIAGGAHFAEALASHPATSSPELLAMVRSAEATGNLEAALDAIVQERLKQERTITRIQAAIRYPIFLLLLSFCVLMFFLTFVVPQFANVVGEFGAKANPFLELVIGTSNLLVEHGRLMAGVAAAALLASLLALRNRQLRRSLFAPLKRLPIVRGVVALSHTTTFCRSLGMLLSSGITLSDSLRLILDARGGDGPLTVLHDRVRRGARLYDAVCETSFLPPLAARMLHVGEESGSLAQVALRCADFYEAKLTEQIDNLTGIIGPAAIVLISVVIGTLMISIMSTLLSVNQMVL